METNTSQQWDTFWYSDIREGLPRVLGNKGTWPFTFREQGYKRKIKLGTLEQKHILGNREQQNRRTREHKENFVGNKGTWTPSGGPH